MCVANHRTKVSRMILLLSQCLLTESLKKCLVQLDQCLVDTLCECNLNRKRRVYFDFFHVAFDRPKNRLFLVVSQVKYWAVTNNQCQIFPLYYLLFEKRWAVYEQPTDQTSPDPSSRGSSYLLYFVIWSTHGNNQTKKSQQ